MFEKALTVTQPKELSEGFPRSKTGINTSWKRIATSPFGYGIIISLHTCEPQNKT